MGNKISVRKTIYILDSEALDRLNNQGNQSQYITDLILMDNKNKPITKDDVVNIVQGMLKSYTPKDTDTTNSTNIHNDNIKKKAKGLFSL